jgi:hypothetical protein
MSDYDTSNNQTRNPDAAADVVAIIAILAIVLTTVLFWLSGMN